MSEELRKKFEKSFRVPPKGVGWVDFENCYRNLYEGHAEQQGYLYQMEYLAYKAGAESVQKQIQQLKADVETRDKIISNLKVQKNELIDSVERLKADKAELVEGVSKILDKLEKSDEVANKDGFMTKADMLDLLIEVFDDLNQLPIAKHKEPPK